jgi:DNA polymerase III subunit epsilon
MPDLHDDFESMASALEQSGEYRVLRRLVPRPLSKQPLPDSKIAILLDFETTGLNTLSDEVIELGMVKFCYSDVGEVMAVVDAFSSFNQPSKFIPPKVIDLTGITDDMVSGQRIDPDAVGSYVAEANVVIAHNANFDRKFAERGWPIFIEKHWACSAQEVEWRKHGFDGSRLAYLLSGAGFFHEAHRAVDDCQAQLEVLARPLPNTDRTALSVMLERARRPTFRIWAENSPFDLKDQLKRRGYRWNDGNDGRPRSWFVDVSEDARDEEMRFLKEAIYQREIDLIVQRITAANRFSIRA